MTRITGSQLSGSNHPILVVDWSVVQQDPANSRSLVNAKVLLKVVGTGINYRAYNSGSLTIDGGRYTFSGGGRHITANGEYQFGSINAWVSQPNNAAKTINISASYPLAITWMGRFIQNITLSGSATLPALAAQGDKISIDSSSVTAGSTVRIDIERGAQSARRTFGFINASGQYVTFETNTTSTGGTYQLPASVAEMRTVTFYVDSYDSSGQRIGRDTTTATVTVPSGLQPSIDSVTVSEGDGTVTFYIQASGRGGASIERIETVSTDTGVTRLGASATFNVNRRGTFTVDILVTDSRGQTASTRRSYDVKLRQPPKITLFTPARVEGTNTTVKAYLQADADAYPFTATVSWREKGSTYWRDSFKRQYSRRASETITAATGFAVEKSYEVRLVVVDANGQKAEAYVTVSSSDTVMTWGKNSVGVGMIPTTKKGLQVKGGVYDENGDTYLKWPDIASSFGNMSNEINRLKDLVSGLGGSSDLINVVENTSMKKVLVIGKRLVVQTLDVQLYRQANQKVDTKISLPYKYDDSDSHFSGLVLDSAMTGFRDIYDFGSLNWSNGYQEMRVMTQHNGLWNQPNTYLNLKLWSVGILARDYRGG